jgi:Flp pilus assembly protein TadG
VIRGVFRRLRHLAVQQDGAAAVEFALITPAFLLMLAGLLAYGLYFTASHALQQLAADAARVSVAGLSAGERAQLVATYISRNAAGYVLIDPAALTFETADSPRDANQYQVTLRYDATDLPIWNLYLPLPMPQKTIIFTSTIRKGGI